MAEKLKVLKRDGSFEEFDPGKIARVATAAGLKVDQAQELSARVAKWVNGLGQEMVSSLKIRDKVLEELRKVNKYAADLYEWYGKTKT